MNIATKQTSGVAIITFANPPVNALTAGNGFLRTLRDALARLAQRTRPKDIVR